MVADRLSEHTEHFFLVVGAGKVKEALLTHQPRDPKGVVSLPWTVQPWEASGILGEVSPYLACNSSSQISWKEDGQWGLWISPQVSKLGPSVQGPLHFALMRL